MTRASRAARLSALLILLAAGGAAALDPNRLLTQYRIPSWGTGESLPSMWVSCAARTPGGYLWVGTTEGRARFDGNRFVVFDRSNTPAFRLSEIATLFVNHAGTLWAVFAGSGLALRLPSAAKESSGSAAGRSVSGSSPTGRSFPERSPKGSRSTR